MMKSNPHPNVTSFKDRHGKTRYRFRRTGMPVFNFTCPPDSDGFEREYELACKGRSRPERQRSPTRYRTIGRHRAGSLRDKRGKSIVYVVGPACGPVKIGWSTDVHARLKDLQTGQHRQLKVMALIPGGEALERELHRRFVALRIRGEWFRWDADLREHVASLLANLGDGPLANPLGTPEISL